jgi:hypothetical protein
VFGKSSHPDAIKSVPSPLFNGLGTDLIQFRYELLAHQDWHCLKLGNKIKTWKTKANRDHKSEDPTVWESSKHISRNYGAKGPRYTLDAA